MTSKTKLLKKGKYTPEAVKNSASAPAKKAENKNATTTVASDNYSRTKEAKARSRARRIRSMLKLGMPKELIEEMFAQEDNRMVLVLLYGTYTVEDGTRTIKIHKRDKQHKVCSIETKEVPNILRGFEAAKHYVDANKLHFMSGSRNAMWILTDKNNVDDVVEKLKILGRVSVTKPEVNNKETKKKAPKKPTNNTVEVRKAAKAKRKADNIKKAEMRPYYAALRKGGVSERIKKYNKTLADKIEKWLKEMKAAEASRKKGSEEERAKHRQLTSVEMKGRKRARKAAKFLATQQRRKEAEKKRQEANAKAHEAKVAAAKKKNPVQTEIKMAA